MQSIIVKGTTMSIFEKTKLIAMQKSRFKKLDHFYSLCDKQSFVLDVGVSKNKYADFTNLFLKNFKLTDTQYTGLAVQKMDGIRKKYPEKKFVEYPGGVFPFDDEEFDWVFSNAVIEHVGNREDQLLFLNEMLRVGKNVFFTTPLITGNRTHNRNAIPLNINNIIRMEPFTRECNTLTYFNFDS